MCVNIITHTNTQYEHTHIIVIFLKQVYNIHIYIYKQERETIKYTRFTLNYIVLFLCCVSDILYFIKSLYAELTETKAAVVQCCVLRSSAPSPRQQRKKRFTLRVRFVLKGDEKTWTRTFGVKAAATAVSSPDHPAGPTVTWEKKPFLDTCTPKTLYSLHI